MESAKSYIRLIFWCCLFVAFWWASVHFLKIRSYIFPDPIEVFRRFNMNISGYAVATAITLSEAAIGLLLALVTTTILGVSFSLSRCIDRYASSVLVAMQSVPILAIAPLLTMWFGPGFVSKAVTAFLVCFFPLAVGWSSGIQSVGLDERDLFRTMGATRLQTARWLYVPRALPYFFSGLRVAAPLSVLGAIVGEFVGANKGLGFLILSHSYYARTADIFVCIIIVSSCGMLIHHLVTILEGKILFWHGEEKH